MPEEYQAPLPESAQMIADVIGRDATLHLARHLKYDHLIYDKGRRCRLLYIPKKKKLKDNYWLVTVVGLENATLLQQEFGGCLLNLATCSETLRGERNAKINDAYKSGKTILEISALFGISTRSVYDIVSNTRHAKQTQNQKQHEEKQPTQTETQVPEEEV